MKTKLLYRGAGGIFIILFLLAVPSCRKYLDPPPFFEDDSVTVQPASRRVLIIGIDGAVGSEYKTIQPPALIALEAHSKFSWEAVSDEVTTDAASWKTLMSGVSYSKHQIKDSSFIYTQPSGAPEHEVITSYPSFFSYILSSTRSDLNTAIISPWSGMVNKLVPEVQDKVVAVSNAAVKDSALIRIKNPSSDLIVIDFNSVAIAGKANGFSAASAGYKDAVLKVDGYVGELMTALKSRPEYNKSEEWLVIITGTHGGSGNSYGGSSQKETNVVSFYYSERIQQTEMIRTGAFSGMQITGKDASLVKAQVLNDGGLYNPETGQQTIQIKVKGSNPGGYPHFFSKTERWPSTPGWSFFSSSSGWAAEIRSTTGAGIRAQNPQVPTGNVFDNSWHTLTLVLADSASKRWVRRYTDGVRNEQQDITTTIDISSVSPLTIGFGADPGQPATTFYSADIMIFNTALTDKEIKDVGCMADITKHPKYVNLIGYWPGNDGFGGRFKNEAPNQQNLDFILQGPGKWEGVKDVPCTAPAPSTDPKVVSLLLKGVDVARTTLYWLRIPVQDSWGLEGSTWLSQYELEFVK